MIYHTISEATSKGVKQLAVLIDPDKTDESLLPKLIGTINEFSVDYIFVGGSLLTQNFLEPCIENIKKHTAIPLVLFPGNLVQISHKADGILLLSLISGRNAELLIGNHVIAAPLLRNSNLEIIPTGYMLIESGKYTSALYMSNTNPIPADKSDIAQSTAIAGEMLGLKIIYMDAGSGAQNRVPLEMITGVKKTINIPLIIGGGIRSTSDAVDAWQAGADIVVIGNAIEKNTGVIAQVSKARDTLNAK